jgi:23S rRNA pseudouridine1911/1915/1917 synthase
MVEEFTVADFVRARMSEPEDTNRPGIVHRLDRDTSGILIAAKDSETKRLLQKQFQDRKAHKTYLAVVSGEPKQHTATLDLPIERNPKRPAEHRVGVNGKPAITRYEVLASNGRYSVVMLYPQTGRTHQLRVHMAYIGTPIVGDRLYSGAKSPIGRLCLHAQSLEITIPVSRRETFTAEPPEDLKEFIESIHD